MESQYIGMFVEVKWVVPLLNNYVLPTMIVLATFYKGRYVKIKRYIFYT